MPQKAASPVLTAQQEFDPLNAEEKCAVGWGGKDEFISWMV